MMQDSCSPVSGEQAASGSTPQYNPIFERLVADPNDLAGLAAYALYKDHKRRWLLKLREKREPTKADEETFLAGVQAALDSYREQARDALVAYAEAYVSEVRGQIESDAIAGRIDSSARRIEDAGGWARQITVGVASSLVTTAVLVFLTLGAQIAGIDLLDYLSALSPDRAPQVAPNTQ